MRNTSHPKTGHCLSRHHLIPKSRKKDQKKIREIKYVLKLWRDRHNYWHFLFKNMTLDEIIETLKRVKRIKKC